jgi:inosine/xanthosine triphosphatase
MLVAVGSANPAKVRAAKKAFSRFFPGAKVKAEGIGVPSGVRAQPLSINEAMRGAKNRAKRAYAASKQKCDYSVGLEAGLFRFPCNSGWMDFTACAIYDGKRFHFGASPAFEYPRHITKRALRGTEIGDMFTELTGDKDSGRKGGAIGFLSKGRVKREDYVAKAVEMALVPLTRRDLYE